MNYYEVYKEPTGYNLPPGVSDQDIDDHMDPQPKPEEIDWDALREDAE